MTLNPDDRALEPATPRAPLDRAYPTRSSLRLAAQLEAGKQRTPQKRTARGVATAAVMTVTAGLFGTMALPAFATGPDAGTDGTSTTALTQVRTSAAQDLVVGDVASADVSRDGYAATSQATLDAAAAAEAQRIAGEQAAAAAEAQRAANAERFSSYSGPTAADYAATTAPVAGSGAQAAYFATAQEYIGTPYVFGGATPAGFDCSGFIMFVLAQHGVSVPHSVGAQSRLGTPISASEAVPGDVVVFDDGSHDGFYAGNGMILDAPKPGDSVRMRPIWSSAVHYVRF